jgi:single-strand DNA-binding protein
MANVNKVILIGNLTRTPEVRQIASGQSVAEFGIAVNRKFVTDSGEKREEVTFVDITVWGRTAELVGKYLTKGRQVYLEGRLQLNTWDDKMTGEKRSKLRVIGEHIEFLGQRSDGEAGDRESRVPVDNGVAAARSTRYVPPPIGLAAAELDDIPF